MVIRPMSREIPVMSLVLSGGEGHNLYIVVTGHGYNVVPMVIMSWSWLLCLGRS